MVHALQEIHRVLIPGGFLIDLRPFIAMPPVDIICGDQVLAAGVIDDSAGVSDDLAANDAIAHVLKGGWFSHEEKASFGLYTYWDTLEAFLTYMDRRMTAILPTETRNQLELLLPRCDRDARIRTRLHMIIARYRKQSLA
jgi:hypothetical protein